MTDKAARGWIEPWVKIFKIPACVQPIWYQACKSYFCSIFGLGTWWKSDGKIQKYCHLKTFKTAKAQNFKVVSDITMRQMDHFENSVLTFSMWFFFSDPGHLRPSGRHRMRGLIQPPWALLLLQPQRVPAHHALPPTRGPDLHDDLRLFHHHHELREIRENRAYL